MKTKSTELSRVQQLLEAAEGKQEAHLYFVTRELKEGIKSSAHVMQKYDFMMHKIEISNDVREMLLSIVADQLNKVSGDETISIVEYEAIVDDEPRVYTYQLKNKAMSFAAVLTNQLPKGVKSSIGNVSEFIAGHKLWAFCVDILPAENGRIVSFTKISPSRVAVDKVSNPESGVIDKFIAKFDVNSSLLELVKGDTINFDKRIDCLYDFEKDEFLIFNKSNFEKIVGLEEEFKEVAEEVVLDLKNSKMIDGLETLAGELEGNPSLHRKLYKLKRSPDYKALDSKRVAKMKIVAKSFKLKLNLKGGKLIVETKDDLDLVIKLLDDYFLDSEQTGNKYGASVKKKL